MVHRNRHFRGADEIQLILGNPIGLFFSPREVGRAHHRLVFHQV
jgi:hypothetical protein